MLHFQHPPPPWPLIIISYLTVKPPIIKSYYPYHITMRTSHCPISHTSQMLQHKNITHTYSVIALKDIYSYFFLLQLKLWIIKKLLNLFTEDVWRRRGAVRVCMTFMVPSLPNTDFSYFNITPCSCKIVGWRQHLNKTVRGIFYNFI